MEEQRRRSQEASKFGVGDHGVTFVDARTAFQGYEGLESEGRVVALLKGGSPWKSCAAERRAKWCSIARPSMPRRAVRSGTPVL